MVVDRKELLQRFAEKYGFETIDLELLNCALTHRSFVYEQRSFEINDNERLEFLGDAVISTVVAEYLYKNFETASEGELSKLRARLVSRVMLGHRGEEMQLGDLLRLGKGEEQSGGRKRRSTIGSALEAVVGAVYLSLGLEKAQDFILRYIIVPSVPVLIRGDYYDYKSRVQEMVQKMHKAIPEYRLVQEEGPEHKKTFTIEVWIDNELYGSGKGHRKKDAENRAAKEAYTKLLEIQQHSEKQE